MEDMIMWIGRLAGVGGIVVCVVAAIFRLSGRFLLGPVQLGTLFQIGIAAMIFGCFCLLSVLTERT
jgi:hypothetical protein